ncbi:PIN domain-containing protein [Nitrospira sp. Kam-Ns4a]
MASSFLFEELHRVLTRKFGYSRQEANEVVALLRPQLVLVTPQPLDSPACSGPDDDKIVGTALAGGCRCLVTGDKEVLALKRYKTVDIIAPGDFWRYAANEER